MAPIGSYISMLSHHYLKRLGGVAMSEEVFGGGSALRFRGPSQHPAALALSLSLSLSPLSPFFVLFLFLTGAAYQAPLAPCQSLHEDNSVTHLFDLSPLAGNTMV